MATVWSDEDKNYAVDWDWGRRFTVWTLTGRYAESKYAEKVLDHDLPSRPSSEEAAGSEARRWWQSQGRSEVRAAADR
ncbi:MAG: hypothetical protein FWE35_06855 [Streptosporangiales bacterium]|nr:hypothetical protein [Streptosporangiales bacterium]